MKRRQLLQASVLFASAWLARPHAATAMGGTLPELDRPAPAFRLPAFTADQPEATTLGLEDFRGRWLALYFYPKDFTGGCTLEARGFQNDLARFHSLEAEVVGISADALDDHAAFCDSEGLAFPLLSDPGGKVSQLYGSWLPPFSQRHTFLIDPEGALRARWVAVRPSGHSQEVLDELERLRQLPSGSLTT